MADTTTIEERLDGPLVVKHPAALKDADGGAIETGEVVALCRCGASENKPFCDGSHKDSGFSSTRPDVSERDRVFSYTGKSATVYYNKLLCSHAGECGARLKSVFDPGRKPWIEPDNGPVEAIEDVVRACPSGALRLRLGTDEPRHIVDAGCVVEIERNGPYRVRNAVMADAPSAEGASGQKYVLCRCGLSGNKPYCDGTHHDQKWRDG